MFSILEVNKVLTFNTGSSHITLCADTSECFFIIETLGSVLARLKSAGIIYNSKKEYIKFDFQFKLINKQLSSILDGKKIFKIHEINLKILYFLRTLEASVF